MSEHCEYVHPYGAHAGEPCNRAKKCGKYCNTHKEFAHGVCSAILEQGAKKGKQRNRPRPEGSTVCGKHATFAKVSELKIAGKFKCYTHRCSGAVDSAKAYCEDCCEKKSEVIDP